MRALFIIATPDRPPPTLTKPEKFTPEFIDFITKCLVKDPKGRPSGPELLSVRCVHSILISSLTTRCSLANAASVHQEGRAAWRRVLEDAGDSLPGTKSTKTKGKGGQGAYFHVALIAKMQLIGYAGKGRATAGGRALVAAATACVGGRDVCDVRGVLSAARGGAMGIGGHGMGRGPLG